MKKEAQKWAPASRTDQECKSAAGATLYVAHYSSEELVGDSQSRPYNHPECVVAEKAC